MGSKNKKTCAGWANKKKCDKNLKDGPGKVSSVCGKSCDHCAAAPTAAPSAAPTETPTMTFAPTSEPPSAAPSAVPSLAPTTCTNTKKGTFQVKGSKKKKNCKGWAKKGKCNKQMKDGSGQVFSVCGKSCVYCAPLAAPTAAPTETWKPSSTFKPS